jgi:hypothetical protein
VCAVGEGITVASLGRLECLGEASVAGRAIGRDQARAAVPRALDDLEGGEARGRSLLDDDLVDMRQWRRLLAQVTQEVVERFAATVQLDLDPCVRVSDPAGQTVACR